MLGHLPLPMAFGQYFTVYGGPYRDVPLDMRGLSLDPFNRLHADMSWPIPDFQAPTVGYMQRVIDDAVGHILSGEPVYVGCTGGIGRTGTVMACLAKTFGVRLPISYTRSKYLMHAIETQPQLQLVRDFHPLLRTVFAIRLSRVLSLFRFRRDLTRPTI